MNIKEHIHYFSLSDIHIILCESTSKATIKMIFLHMKQCGFLNDGLFIRISQILIFFFFNSNLFEKFFQCYCRTIFMGSILKHMGYFLNCSFFTLFIYTLFHSFTSRKQQKCSWDPVHKYKTFLHAKDEQSLESGKSNENRKPP